MGPEAGSRGHNENYILGKFEVKCYYFDLEYARASIPKESMQWDHIFDTALGLNTACQMSMELWISCIRNDLGYSNSYFSS